LDVTMRASEMHPEDIKAELRKRFGTVLAFEDAANLPRKSVSDFLRGRSSRRVRDAIDETIKPSKSEKSDNSAAQRRRKVAA